MRPEKISMNGEDGPASDAHRRASPGGAAEGEPGTVREVVYVGAVTRYVVELDGGGTLTVLRQNLERSSAETLEEQGTRVRHSWRPGHTFAIEGREREEEQP